MSPDRTRRADRACAQGPADRGCGHSGLVDRLDESFDRAVRMLHDCQGRVIVTGMGKSGIICRKIAATLASTGTAAFFLHPAEATHGDLGVIQPSDLLLAISHSGETQEVLRLLEAIRRIGAKSSPSPEPGFDTRTGSGRRARLPGIRGSVPAQSRAHRQHDRGARDGRRTLHDAARGKGIPRGGLREIHPGGKLGKKLMRVDQLMHGGARRRSSEPTRRCAT